MSQCEVNSLSPGKFYLLFCRSWFFSKSSFFEKFFQEYHLSVKQIGFRSGPTYCRAWSGSKLFSKVISRRHWEIRVQHPIKQVKQLLDFLCAIFHRVSTEFLALMKKVAKSPLVMDVVNIPNVQRQLERLADLLGKIQKALGEYLERERASFPR